MILYCLNQGHLRIESIPSETWETTYILWNPNVTAVVSCVSFCHFFYSLTIEVIADAATLLFYFLGVFVFLLYHVFNIGGWKKLLACCIVVSLQSDGNNDDGGSLDRAQFLD
ncbi:hypothetical protein ACJX0J_010395 [Zea mays]